MRSIISTVKNSINFWAGVVAVLYYSWQIDLLERGFVSLSHAKFGCALNHNSVLCPTSCLDVTCYWEVGMPHTRSKLSAYAYLKRCDIINTNKLINIVAFVYKRQ